MLRWAAPSQTGYGYVDQSLAFCLLELVERLCADLAGMIAVIIHPYRAGAPIMTALSLRSALHPAGPLSSLPPIT